MDNTITYDEQLVEMLKHSADRPVKKEAFSDPHSAAGTFALSACKDLENPVLISACAGIGAKLKVALSMNRFDSIGWDCVALSANDILSKGATPLFFSYHIACSKKKSDVLEQIMKGITDSLTEAGASLAGGRILELSDLYGADELGVTGFMVGIMDRENGIDGSTIKPGNSIIGILSSGLHSSGYESVSNVFRNFNEGILNTHFDSIGGVLGDVMLEPVCIYSKAVNNIRKEGIRIRGLAHISNGSLKKSLGQILPADAAAYIGMDSFAHPPIFRMIEETGGYSREVMFDTFNMGIGMAVVVASQDRDAALAAVRHSGHVAFLIGTIKEGGGEVFLED